MTDVTHRISGTTTAGRLARLEARQAGVRAMEERARARQHARGRLTARERVELLLDPGSFTELDRFVRHRCDDFGMGASRPDGDGVVTGFGTVDGRHVCVFSQDFTVFGGSMGEAFGQKVLKVIDLAVRLGCPVVSINDSGGARIQEGVVSLAYYASLGERCANASGIVPQISLVLGPCAGGAVYMPALTDFVVMAEGTSYMFVAGPEVVSAGTGQRTSVEELGGAWVNSAVAGNVHHVGPDEPSAIGWVRDLLGYLPANYLELPPTQPWSGGESLTREDLALDGLVPDGPQQPYDMHDVIRRVVDHGELLEIQEDFARNIICGFARVEGATVGVVANQPTFCAGSIDIDASEKGGRFVRFCDSFNIPVVTFTDVPGFLPGLAQERGGLIRRGAKLLYAYAEATVPTVTVVTRKAYGGAYAVMGSKHLQSDVNLAWPTAEIAVMGHQSAVRVLHRRQLAEVEEAEREQLRLRLEDGYRRTLATPYVAAERGYVDRVVRPARTRIEVARALRMLRGKCVPERPRRHSNLPL